MGMPSWVSLTTFGAERSNPRHAMWYLQASCSADLFCPWVNFLQFSNLDCPWKELVNSQPGGICQQPSTAGGKEGRLGLEMEVGMVPVVG